LNYTNFRQLVCKIGQRFSTKSLIAFSVAAVLTVSLAGCGGEDKKDTKPAESPKPNPKAAPE
jgi:hypothetical protein